MIRRIDTISIWQSRLAARTNLHMAKGDADDVGSEWLIIGTWPDGSRACIDSASTKERADEDAARLRQHCSQYATIIVERARRNVYQSKEKNGYETHLHHAKLRRRTIERLGKDGTYLDAVRQLKRNGVVLTKDRWCKIRGQLGLTKKKGTKNDRYVC